MPKGSIALAASAIEPSGWRWGPIRLAASTVGLVAVGLATEREAFEDGLFVRFEVSARWTRSPVGTLAAAVAALTAMIERGDTGALQALPVDLADRPAWDRLVLGAVRSIPAGRTLSYGEVARVIGRPGAARAVGGAVGRNPLALVVPCHRVIAADGTLGGYGGSWWGERDRLLELKAELLAREGRVVRRRATRAVAAD
jgi:methylated-DNA-[protein]-cysteine S-methyltransferase